jgi:hypothetical protein
MALHQAGRPTRYTKVVAGEICDRLATGESLRSICSAEHLPHEATVRQWATDNYRGFYTQYARARNVGLDVLADEVLGIADHDAGDVARDRLRFDARRWYLSKLAPKRYGDKVEVEHGVDESLAERLIQSRKRAGIEG